MSSEHTPRRVPNRVEDLTPKWFSEILGQKVCESTFTVTPNDAGLGFMSTLVRVKFQTDNGEHHHLVVKLLPEESVQVLGETRKAILLDHFDRAEIFTYKILMPELIKEIPDVGKYFCGFVHGDICEGSLTDNISYSSVLVLQDLKPEGYFMVNFAQDFQPSQFAQGLDFLSKLHASSLSLEKRLGVSLASAYPWFPKWYDPIEPGENRRESTLYGMVQDGFPDLYKLLELNPNTPEETYKTLKEAIEPNMRKIVMAIMKAGRDFPCFIHGDIWPHNILVHPNDQSPIKALDWQMPGYTDPAYDVTVFITFGSPYELMTEAGITQKLLEYYEHSSELKKRLGIENGRTWSEFEQFSKSYGLGYSLFWWTLGCPILRSDPNFAPKAVRMLGILTDKKVLDFLVSLI